MEKLLVEYKEEFENSLSSELDGFNGIEEPLASAMKYALSGGKRLRPILTYFGADFMRESHAKVYPLALGIECIHNYSLVHDDLPCMDNDDLRHGKPSTHKQFGYGMGVLTGDALLNYAAEIMLNGDITNSNYYKAVGYMMRMAGANGMIGGQCIDIKNQNLRSKTLEEVIKLNMLKTSCLFKAALVGSCISLGADENEIRDLEFYTEKLGLIFQIVDDILDITSTTEILGKNICSDTESNKITYIDMVGIDKAKEDIGILEKQAISGIEKYGERANNLIDLCRYLSHRTK